MTQWDGGRRYDHTFPTRSGADGEGRDDDKVRRQDFRQVVRRWFPRLPLPTNDLELRIKYILIPQVMIQALPG
jgi:hypothetical protein